MQALRGVAAVAVVLCHAARHVDKVSGAPMLIALFQAGHAGVDLFFVISGFIILFVHRADIGAPGRLGHYFGRRFNRVMPLYWIALAVTVGMSLAGGHMAVSAGRIIWSASLLPSVQEPLLGIAWTLQYEVVFYAAFAVLIVRRDAGLVVFAAWFVCILLKALGIGMAALPPQFSAPYGLEFFMGMLAAHLVQPGRVPAAPWIALPGLAGFVSALVLESAGVLDGFGLMARLVYGPAALLLVAGVASGERGGRISVPAWLQALGEASYSIYLFQFVFIGLVWQAWLKLGLPQHGFSVICFVALALAGVLGGVVVSRLIEHPLLRLTRGKAPARVVA